MPTNLHSHRSTLKASIKRRLVRITSHEPARVISDNAQSQPTEGVIGEECTALVVNSSFAMAKEITLAITLKIPGCSIMYAPGIELAKWILRKRKIDLVVSSAILPDGSIDTLIPVCEALTPPPDLVVVGGDGESDYSNRATLANLRTTTRYFGNGFQKVDYRHHANQGDRLEGSASHATGSEPSRDQVKTLGADLRNDFNNPLQEIVSMVFVAKAGKELSSTTLQALEAIDRAAKGIASTVEGLEDRIRTFAGKE